MDDSFVINKLISYEKRLGRPIRRIDITKENIGFSMIVINRIWGSLAKCKEEIGLLKTPPSSQPKSFEYYKNLLDIVLNDISKSTTRKFITWKDIENNNIGITIEHKTLTNAFIRNGEDIYEYIKKMGFMMNPSSFSFHYTFDSGERVLSSMEYDLSNYLNELGYKYNVNYKRDIMYKTFLSYKNNSKLNCDYVIERNDKKYYIEVAGIITNPNDNWRCIEYKDKKNNEYRDKMIKKELLLINNNINYLFLFKNDFCGDIYKDKLCDFLEIERK